MRFMLWRLGRDGRISLCRNAEGFSGRWRWREGKTEGREMVMVGVSGEGGLGWMNGGGNGM